MRSVVTGGAGFIGSHLVEYLLGRGDDVVIIDDLSTGSLRNLAGCRFDQRLRFVEASILDRDVVNREMAGADRVFHLAAAVGVKLIVDRPLDGLITNIHGSDVILQAAMATGTRVMMASTSEIYGKNAAGKLGEDSDRILGAVHLSRWNYAAAKAIDECFAFAYAKERGLDVTIVRLFNTVGPRQTGRYGMVVPNLVGQALRNEPLTVYGDGRQTRCFSYVGDVVPAMVRLAERPACGPEAFNLGGETEISILDLARRVKEVLGSSSEIVLVPYHEAYGEGFEDMRRRVPDNSRAAAVVGFAPTTGIDEIIRAVAEHASVVGRAMAGRPAVAEPSETIVLSERDTADVTV